ncbi:hypothetical protein ACLRDC_12400 [Gluconacetobacter sacchari]|uniref:hypothetical protein n=1 Tax=Gluconacetobacter sacchari TaxID=92759 RepID=UPI0039B59B78
MVNKIKVEFSDLLNNWIGLALDLRTSCLSLLSENPVNTERSLDESVELFATLIFCRTITNFKGAIILFQNGLIVEAQTLQRSCFENSLWLRRLAHEGNDFAKSISDDGLCNETSFAKLLMPTVSDESVAAELREHIYVGSGRKRIDTKGPGGIDGAEEDYAEFRRLSMSAAHPSSTSLLRHVKMNVETESFEIFVEVPVDEREVVTNVFFTIAAMMHTLNSFTECVSTINGEKIRNDMAARIVALQEKSGIA